MGEDFRSNNCDWNGNENVKENMLFIADYYLSHGFSSSKASWPNLPFPYNTMTYSGIFDGDMRNGLNTTPAATRFTAGLLTDTKRGTTLKVILSPRNSLRQTNVVVMVKSLKLTGLNINW